MYGNCGEKVISSIDLFMFTKWHVTGDVKTTMSISVELVLDRFNKIYYENVRILVA